MSRLATVISMLGVTLGCTAGAAAQLADDPARISRAREILALYLKGDDAGFVAAGDEAMVKAFTAEQSAQVREQLGDQFGAYQAELHATVMRTGVHHSVRFELQYERARLKLQVTLDEKGRMSGFHIVGVEGNKPYESPDYVHPEAFREEAVVVRTGEFELPGTLTLPVERVLHPAVVLVHGSGPNDADETIFGNKPFKDLAGGLGSQGVAVLRYEKRTRKYGSTMKPAEITLESETIDDALSAVALLRERPEIDAQRIFVLGHSLGGMAAPFIAARDPKLAGIVLMAGSARPLVDVLDDQVNYLAQSDGTVTTEEKEQIEQLRSITRKLRAGKLDDPTENLMGAPAAYWLALSRLDPAAQAARLTCPILVIQGGRDYQVNMKCFAQWEKALGDKPNAMLKVYEPLNHLMMAGAGPSTPKEYMEPGHVDAGLVRDIAEWVKTAAK